MTPEEFIRKNLKSELKKIKVPFSMIESLADEGVRYWRESAKFKKGAWADTLSHIKKRAARAK